MAIIQKKTILITGCSTNSIGSALARAFHARGYHVFATVRDRPKAGNLAELNDVEILELDVTAASSIAQCRTTVAHRTGGKLSVLVNNAGVEFVSPLLDVDLAAAKQLYDVNVWGALAMTQAFAPLLIAAGGVVVNQSSIDAMLSMAWAGIFASSKAALTRLSETLRIELAPLGVRVVTAMTGSADTPMFDKPGGQLCLPESSHYRGAEAAANRERAEHRSQAMNVEELADRLAKEILGGSSGLVWQGHLASLVRYASWLFPTWYLDRTVNAERGLKHIRRL